MNGQISGVELVRRFFTGTGRTYDRMACLCTLGFDRSWKERMLKHVPDNSTRILDQACGTGILTFMLSQRFPNSKVTGVDVQEEYLRIARGKADLLRLTNVAFVIGRAEEVFLKTELDCITASYLPKYANLETLIGNIKAMLRGGGGIDHARLYVSVEPGSGPALGDVFSSSANVGGQDLPEMENHL